MLIRGAKTVVNRVWLGRAKVLKKDNILFTFISHIPGITLDKKKNLMPHTTDKYRLFLNTFCPLDQRVTTAPHIKSQSTMVQVN